MSCELGEDKNNHKKITGQRCPVSILQTISPAEAEKEKSRTKTSYALGKDKSVPFAAKKPLDNDVQRTTHEEHCSWVHSIERTGQNGHKRHQTKLSNGQHTD
jgi:hypothetical protein